jgi:hypothetical protein
MADEKIIDSNPESSKEGGFNFEEKSKINEIEKTGIENNSKEVVTFSPEKESANETVGAEKDNTYNQILSKVKGSNVGDDEGIKTDAEIILQKKMDAESNVQHLVDLALQKGVVHAVNVARHMDDNYVLDMMHDKMVSENFHRALMDKKLITNN